MAFLVIVNGLAGIAIGFMPELPSDNLQEIIVIMDDKSSSAQIFALPDLHETLQEDSRKLPFFAVLTPEPDLLVWRSQEEFRDWYDRNNGQTIVDYEK